MITKESGCFGEDAGTGRRSQLKGWARQRREKGI